MNKADYLQLVKLLKEIREAKKKPEAIMVMFYD